jgi:cholesterol transport system auxiliary component
MAPKLLLTLLVSALLAGCVGNVRQGDVARYDLGEVNFAWRDPGFPVQGVTVQAPSWLGTTAMHYRLAYADATRRDSYAESRWIAPPAQLLESALNRRIGASLSTGCRVALEVDEWVQQFDRPETSRSRIQVRAALLPAHGEGTLARQAFNLDVPAPSADARGGVQAANAAVASLAGDLAAWLEKVHMASPALVGRCKN